MTRVILWFKNDLRVHDNYVVDRARKLVESGQYKEVLPVYCFDPRHYVKTPFGNPKTGNHRAQFLMQSVLDLKRSLRAIGSDLIIKLGQPEDVIPGLLGGENAKVVTQEEHASEEQNVIAKVKRAIGQASLERLWDGTLYHPEDLPFGRGMKDLPDVFTPFRNKVENRCEPRSLVATPRKGSLPMPSGLDSASTDFQPSRVEDLNEVVPNGAPSIATPQQHPKAVLDFKGGESEALQRLKYYLWDSNLVADYFNTRNGMLGGDYSTKFSPWLAHGCISPRTIFHEISKYESQREKNKSTYWVTFELLWRDFFRFFTVKHGNAIFMEGGTIGKQQRWNDDHELFERWKAGKTGMPLVDANMRELKATGFMSNRGRQNVASYLILDLGIDWRLGADWFESVLADYDVASNWGNWVSAAGLTGGRVNHFNIIKQSKDYDETGQYVKTWLPELARVPQHRVHQPWTMTGDEQQAAGIVLGQDYPQPPKSRYTRDDGGPGGRGGRGGRGNRGRGGGQRGGRGKRQKKHSDFDQYG